MPKKVRLDQLLVDRGHYTELGTARAAILAGDIKLPKDGTTFAGTMLYSDTEVIVREKKKWVGRGAEKLSSALDFFSVSAAGKFCMDIGTGSGGFTQVLLEKNAKCVYSVDVGYGQFDHSLRSDSRVVLLERTNARYIGKNEIPDPVNLFVMDVSFISIFKIVPSIIPLIDTTAGTTGICLFKPNFEAGKDEVGEKGLALDMRLHERLLLQALQSWQEYPVCVKGLMQSPIRGKEGNIEYFWCVEYQPDVSGCIHGVTVDSIKDVVMSAFA